MDRSDNFCFDWIEKTFSFQINLSQSAPSAPPPCRLSRSDADARDPVSGGRRACGPAVAGLGGGGGMAWLLGGKNLWAHDELETNFKYCVCVTVYTLYSI